MKNIAKLFDLNKKNTFISIGIVLSTFFSTIASVCLGKFIDIISGRDTFDDTTKIYLMMLLLIMLVSAITAIALARYIPLKLQLGKSIEYADKTMEALLEINQKDYKSKERGYYINLVTSSAFTYGEIYGQINTELVGNMLCVLTIIVISMYINIEIGFAYILYIPIYFLIAHSPNKKIAEYQKKGLPTQDAFLTNIKKISEEKREINILKADAYYMKKFKEISSRYLKFIEKYRLYSIISENIPKILAIFLLIITMTISTNLYFDGVITLGTIVVIFQISQILQEPLNRCAEIYTYVIINEEHINRIRDFLQKKNDKSGFEDKYYSIKDAVVFDKGVFFADSKRKIKLFEAQNVALPPKGLILIKGKNGTGKSTLVNYITGYSDPEIYDGNIKINNKLKDAAYLTYPALLVDGDLVENMYGETMDLSVYKLLNLEKISEVSSENNVKLSFGEQQKVNLLRIFSKKSDVIILDEPFTNLDKNTIEKLIGYISTLKEKKLIIAIMHSSELDEFADKILMIENQKLNQVV